MLATMRVRIRRAPSEKEVDGVQLDGLTPGLVREVSAIVGSWLIAKGYAVSEMRSTERDASPGVDRRPHSVNDGVPRRRRDDR